MTLIAAATLVGKFFLVLILASVGLVTTTVGFNEKTPEEGLKWIVAGLVLLFLCVTFAVWFWNAGGPLWALPN